MVTYYSIGDVIERPIVLQKAAGSVAQYVIQMKAEAFENRRKIFGLLEFLGELGGITEILLLLLGLVLFPYSEFQFTL